MQFCSQFGHLDFNKLVDPISTRGRGADYALANFQTSLRPCIVGWQKKQEILQNAILLTTAKAEMHLNFRKKCMDVRAHFLSPPSNFFIVALLLSTVSPFSTLPILLR